VMVDKAVEAIHELSLQKNNIIYIDIWTWSWAIPISVVDKNWDKIDKAFAVDISEDALEVAKRNIKTYNLVDKIKLLKSDLLSEIFPLLQREGARGWVITANLPYIKNEDFWNMDQDVILHEPAVALYWWEKTWFELYEKLIEDIINRKTNQKIFLFIEIWFDQKEVAINYLENKKLNFKIFKDNWWIERCVKIEF
jgi:release factor glutamine methyltransferase